MNFGAVLILLAAAVLIAAADALIKQSAISGNFLAALRTPWLWAAVVLYLAEILLTVYLFLKHWQLGVAANVFVIFYSLGTVLLGYLFFQERLSLMQASGILLGLIGIFLMTK